MRSERMPLSALGELPSATPLREISVFASGAISRKRSEVSQLARSSRVAWLAAVRSWPALAWNRYESTSAGPSVPNIGTAGLSASAPPVALFAEAPTASASWTDQVTSKGADFAPTAFVDDAERTYPWPGVAMTRSVNLAMPLTAALVRVPPSLAAVGLVANARVTLAVALSSCPDASRYDASATKVPPGSAAGYTSRRSVAVAAVTACERVLCKGPAGRAREPHPLVGR